MFFFNTMSNTGTIDSIVSRHNTTTSTSNTATSTTVMNTNNRNIQSRRVPNNNQDSYSHDSLRSQYKTLMKRLLRVEVVK